MVTDNGTPPLGATQSFSVVVSAPAGPITIDSIQKFTGFSTVNFTEGHEVRKGDVLFVIDPRPYEAEYKRAEAELARATAQLNLAQSEHVRAQSLLEARAISKEEFEARVSSTEQATANVQAADAALDAAKLNLTYTRVQAPISGLVSRAEVTAGNLVTSDQTLLTTLVSIDPIYVEFEGDEQVYLKYAALARAGLRPNSRDSQNPVWVGLADEQDSPHRGVMVFVDNELNPATGTIRARGRFDNHERRFTPGMFARVKLVGSGQYNALLIDDSAVSTDQSVKYVLAVDAHNKTEYRAVKLGPVVDGLRVVREGLAPGDTIVVNGLQRVRPGMPVTPQVVAMGPQPSSAGVVARNQP